MFAPKKITASLIALGALAALALFSPVDARVHCAPRDQACWDLHGPSTAAERARTDQLNLEAGQASSSDPAYRESQRQYQRELRAYHQEQRRYDSAMQRSHGPRPGDFRRDFRRDGRPGPGFAPRPRPETAQELDNDPCGPTGGQVDPHIAAPTPGLDGATTGLTTFNARTNGNYAACRGPRRR